MVQPKQIWFLFGLKFAFYAALVSFHWQQQEISYDCQDRVGNDLQLRKLKR